FASWDFLSSETSDAVLAALFALTAGIFPAVYFALKLDDNLQIVAMLAGEYKNLEIVFATLENVSSLKPFREFEGEFNQAVERLQAANAHAYPAPEWCFKRVRARRQDIILSIRRRTNRRKSAPSSFEASTFP